MRHSFETGLPAGTRRARDFHPKTRKAGNLKIPPDRGIRSSALMFLAVLSACLSPFAQGQESAINSTNQESQIADHASLIVLPKSVPDPLEPVNRVMWDFNVGLMTGVIKPTSRAYRFVVAKPVRTDRKSTRLNSSHLVMSYAVFCL